MRRKKGPDALVDIVDQETRSRMMGAVRSAHTKPEREYRSLLHRAGIRYRLGSKLKGKPDLVLPKYHAVIFVNGCFWHMHSCHLFRMPRTRPSFWREKLARNKERDAEVRSELNNQGLRCLTVWECALKGKYKLEEEVLLARSLEWIRSAEDNAEISGLILRGTAS